MKVKMNGYIRTIEYYFPDTELSNDDLAELYDGWSAEKIQKKTGIRTRHVCADGECASDLGVKAAQKIFESGAVQKEDIDFVLFCTESPDYILPPSACRIQDRLGLSTACGALDFNLGCSGFVYGLSLSNSLICSGQAKNVLLITSETYSKHIHPQDKSSRTIFGDGAAATLVSLDESNREKIGPFVYGTDGSGYRNLIVPAGGVRHPKNDETAIAHEDEFGSVRSLENLYMDGPEIFNFTIKAVPEAVSGLLDKADKTLDDMDQIVFHQANAYMLKHLRKKIGIPKEKFYVNLKECGNTVSASLPIALKMACDEKKISSGDVIMIVGFGVGYSWAAALIEW